MPTDKSEAARALLVTVLLLGALLAFVWCLPRPAHARWRIEYAAHPEETQQWFKTQRNGRGEWCCSDSDGERFEGGYVLNNDGSVTLDLGNGRAKTLPADLVLRTPNPVGVPIWWHIGERDYCFAPGTLG